MVEFVNNDETRRIANAVGETFSRQAWAVTRTQRAHEPLLQVAKRDISFFIKCIDTAIQKFIGVSDFINRLENFATQYRTRSGEVIVYVISQPLVGLDAAGLPSRGIALFMLNEISTLIAIESVYGKRLVAMDDRTKIIVRGCKDFCVALSKEAIEKGDLDEAQSWLELNLDGVLAVIESRYRLVELLVRKGDLDGAKEAARQGIAISPYNHILLGKLRDLEKKTGNIAALPELDEQIEMASQARPSLETILAKQQVVARNSNSSNQSTKPDRMAGFLRRLFVRSS
jgi:hypothetical protein